MANPTTADIVHQVSIPAKVLPHRVFCVFWVRHLIVKVTMGCCMEPANIFQLLHHSCKNMHILKMWT